MTKSEWLEIGYDKGIIELQSEEEIAFRDAFVLWFKMKMNFQKASTIDRIEVTFNRYYDNCPFIDTYVSAITDSDILHFLMKCILDWKCLTYKELGRILQIVTGVCNYMRDIGKGGCPLHDWEMIKRNLPLDALDTGIKKENAVPTPDVKRILTKVIHENIYPEKRNSCLCLCMNFYLGLRIGELACLTFEDFDFERYVVKIRKTESKCYNRDENGERIGTMVYRVSESCKTVYSVREIPLLPEVVAIYEKIKHHHASCRYDSPYLCYDGSDCILIRQLDRVLRRLCYLCEVSYFNSHEIRKTFATAMHYAGIPTRAISDLMGHSEIGTTENCYILSYNKNYELYRDYMKSALKY